MSDVLNDGQDATLIGYRERAAIYHKECSNTEDHSLLACLAGSLALRILEIPAGVGRNLPVWQNARQAEIVVADIEPEMVRRLQDRIAQDPCLSHIRAVQADMTQLTVESLFDLIVVPQEAFQLIARHETAGTILRQLADCLTDGGRLYVDIARLAPTLDGPFPSYYDPSIPDGVSVREWSTDLGDSLLLHRNRVQQHVESYVGFRLEYTIHHRQSVPRRFVSEMTLCNFTRLEISRFAEQAGLEIVSLFSDYKFSQHSDASARCIYIMKKARSTPATLYT